MCNAHLFLLQNTRTPNISGHSNKAKCPLYIILLPLQYPRLERGSCCEITVNICYFTCLINMSHLKFLRRKNCHAGVFRSEKHPHGSFFSSKREGALALPHRRELPHSCHPERELWICALADERSKARAQDDSWRGDLRGLN